MQGRDDAPNRWRTEMGRLSTRFDRSELTPIDASLSHPASRHGVGAAPKSVIPAVPRHGWLLTLAADSGLV